MTCKTFEELFCTEALHPWLLLVKSLWSTKFAFPFNFVALRYCGVFLLKHIVIYQVQFPSVGESVPSCIPNSAKQELCSYMYLILDETIFGTGFHLHPVSNLPHWWHPVTNVPHWWHYTIAKMPTKGHSIPWCFSNASFQDVANHRVLRFFSTFFMDSWLILWFRWCESWLLMPSFCFCHSYSQRPSTQRTTAVAFGWCHAVMSKETIPESTYSSTTVVVCWIGTCCTYTSPPLTV
jgi:hypothetical protein